MGAGSTRDALPCLLQVRLEIQSVDQYDAPHFMTLTLRFLCVKRHGEGGPSSQKRKHLRKKMFLQFFKNESSMIRFMKMTTSSAATTWPSCSDSSCLSSSSSPSPSSCRPSSRWPRWEMTSFWQLCSPSPTLTKGNFSIFNRLDDFVFIVDSNRLCNEKETGTIKRNQIEFKNNELTL